MNEPSKPVVVKTPEYSLIGTSTTISSPAGSSGLASETLERLRDAFTSSGHCPSHDMWEAIGALAERLEAMADGRCEPAFFLSSLDPGVGKTQTVIRFLQALMASPKHEDVGVIVCIFSINEIREISSQSGLSSDEFAVMTSDKEANQLGSANPSSARVLFTTQQRVQKVCTGRSFSDTVSFHYRDAPRQVRIWDESLLPAEPITVNRLDIARLPGLLPHHHMPIAHALEALSAKLKDIPDRTLFEVPDLAEQYRVNASQMLRLIDRQPDDVKLIARNLWSMFGTKVRVRHDGQREGTLVTFRDGIPFDLAPLVILDASGRVRTTYKWWEEQRNTLVRLPAAAKNYDRLTIHVWPTGGGAWAFQHEGAYEILCKGIIDLINSSDERWLVVCHKLVEKRLAADIKRELRGDRNRVALTHWGAHRATNQYGDFPNVLLAGTQFYRHSSYEAIGRGAWGLPPEQQFSEQQERELEVGEHCDLLLQAVCRAAARKSDDDRCQSCNACIIGTERVTEHLQSIFPGCHLTTWGIDEYPSLPDKAFEAMAFIRRWLEDHPTELLTFKTVMKAIGETDSSNFNRNVRRDPGFQWALGAIGACEESLGKQRAKGFRKMTFDDYFPSDD
jgi:hypothetical protein